MLVKNSWSFILYVWYSKQKQQQLCGQQQVNSETDSQVYTVYWIDEGLAPAAMLVQYHTPKLFLGCAVLVVYSNSSDVFSFSSLLNRHIWKNTCFTCYFFTPLAATSAFLTSDKSDFFERKNNWASDAASLIGLACCCLQAHQRYMFICVYPTMRTVLHRCCIQSRLSAVVDQEIAPVHDHFYFYMCQPGEMYQ